MQGRKSSTSRAASVHQIGTGDDLVLNYMAKHGIPMTHQNWLEISYYYCVTSSSACVGRLRRDSMDNVASA